MCDGCGKCCLHKLEDEETGELYPTNVACRLLDRRTGRCKDYKHRHAYVPECVRLTARNVDDDRLAADRPAPIACCAEGKPLEDWHPLVSGDPESVHTAGMSVRGWTVSEDDAGDLENHLVDREL